MVASWCTPPISKTTLAGVPAGLLHARGPVDVDVAQWLARGAAQRCSADWGLATTGVAGPEPQDGVPVGTVFVGLFRPDGSTTAKRLDLTGDRAEIRAASVAAALDLLASAL